MNRTYLTPIVVALSLAGACTEDEAPRVPTPALSSSQPEAGATVPRTGWVALTFESAPDPASFAAFALDCGAGAQPITVDALTDTMVVVNPAGTLPPSSSCTLTWRGPSADESVSFSVAAEGEPVEVVYDRDDLGIAVPFPDDFLLEDADTKTGKVFAMPELEREGGAKIVLTSLSAAVGEADGHSPLAPFVVQLAAEPDPASLPQSPEESLSPLSTMLLIDVDEEGDAFGERVPFTILYKNLSNAQGETEHVMVVYPSRPLSPESEYALVLTKRAFADPTRPLQASPFLLEAMSDERETDAQQKVGAITDEVMGALRKVYAPLRRDDIALVLRSSIRSMDRVADDMLAVRAALDELPAPTFTIDDVSADSGSVAAIVRGTWDAPKFWDGDYVNRDGSGAPLQDGTEPVEFVLALPATPLGTAAPVIMYQHGNPGSASNEVPGQARSHLAEAGFAVIGFTSLLNRPFVGEPDPIGAQLNGIFNSLLANSRFPETVCLITNMEQLAFLRLIEALSTLDVLPMGSPDGTPDLDLEAPLSYLGVSNGSHDGMGLLPFAPEIDAAALTVGGGRYATALFHQDGGMVGASGLYDFVSGIFPDVGRGDLYVGLALVQAATDDQDWLNRSHLLLDGELGANPSILMTEGVGDNWVPPYSTRTGASVLELPHVGPHHATWPVLETVDPPLSANVDGATRGFFQFVAAGQEGLAPTPGCEENEEGHFCAQGAPGVYAQRVHFFTTAQNGTPEIIDPH
jgi:hypothetical protein